MRMYLKQQKSFTAFITAQERQLENIIQKNYWGKMAIILCFKVCFTLKIIQEAHKVCRVVSPPVS